MLPSYLNMFIFYFNTGNFRCLPVCPSILPNQLSTPCSISMNFTEQSYHHYETTENFTGTAGWKEEQSSTHALCRKFLKSSLCIKNSLDRKML